MKTLVFCTAFASTQDVWDSRYRRWVEGLRASRLQFDQTLIVDDGSEVVPDWPHLAIVSERDFGEAERVVRHDPLVFYHFEEHLGRKDIRDFPGWYRSFSFAARYAEAQGFGKIIHIESDAYLISPRIVDYVNHLSDGWTVFWCPSYDFPEIAIQIIAGDEVANFARFFRRPYDHLAGATHELVLPYTRVVRNFIGDRYGERTDVPRHADYATQVSGDDEEEYYWWLRSSEPPGEADAADGATQADSNPDSGDAEAAEILIAFGIDGNSEHYVGDGWSDPEGEWRWMVGSESELVLPAFTEEIDSVLVMRVTLCVHDELMPRQRLGIELNDTSIADLELESDTEIAVELPSAPL